MYAVGFDAAGNVQQTATMRLSMVVPAAEYRRLQRADVQIGLESEPGAGVLEGRVRVLLSMSQHSTLLSFSSNSDEVENVNSNRAYCHDCAYTEAAYELCDGRKTER